MGQVTRYSESEQAWNKSEQNRITELQLARGFQVADIYLNRAYLDVFSAAPIISLNRSEMDISKLRLFEISKLVFDAEEKFTDKLMSVYSALHSMESSIARETGELHKEFSQYCGGIYTYKAVDIAKKKNSYEQKMREVKKKGKKGKEDQKSYMEVVYLDANLPDSDGTYGELAADPNKKNRAESEVFAEESRNIFGIYLQKYCQAMTNTKAEPPRALALYYARILPHVLHIMYGIETIPDSKGASAAWAFEHMQEKTMEILGEQSEEEMQELMYDSLQWSEHFWKQMQLEIYINSERMFLKDVVYTEVYDQRKIDDWSESMHKTVTELAHREIKKDKRLVDWAVDHIVESDKTYNLFKGGRKK